MDASLAFWGSQGRVGRITAGEFTGRLIFAYPETMPEWWTYIMEPGPNPGAPGDQYACGTEYVLSLFEEWKVEWMPHRPEEEAIEREALYGWRPLRGPVDWLT